MSKQIIDIGIAESSRVEIADGLSRLLADTYTLYIKTHYYHWNVTGPMFNSLHLMFENQYNELATAVDDIAERIRSLGCFAPGTYHEFSRLTAVNEDKDIPAAKNMIENLVQGQETVVKTARSLFPIVNSGNNENSDSWWCCRWRIRCSQGSPVVRGCQYCCV